MNGNGKIEGLLERIADRLEKISDRLDEVGDRLDVISVEQTQTRRDMNTGFAQVNARIDNVLVIAGRHHDDHEQRIQVLEDRVLGKSS